MKTDKEIVNSLLERRNQYETEKKNKRIILTRTLTPIGCVCLVALLGFGAWQGGMFSKAPNQDIEVSETQNTSQNDKTHNEIIIAENKVNDLSMARINAKATDYSKIPYQVWQSVKKEFNEFTGMKYDDFVNAFPKELPVSEFYSLSTKGYKDAELDDTLRLHDYVFVCKSENGKTARIALCNTESPLRDYFFDDVETELSSINDTTAKVYKYQNLYFVQFTNNGVNYDIETENMDLEGLKDLLISLIK